MQVILEVSLDFFLPVRESLATVGKFPWGIIWANFLVFSPVCFYIPDKASLSLIIAGKRKYCFVCHSSEFETDKCSFIQVMIFFKLDDISDLEEIPLLKNTKISLLYP